MPLDYSDFPEEVQVAFFMFNLLPDNWEGTSGSYMGKDWAQSEFLFKLWEVPEPKQVMFFMKMYEGTLVEYRADTAEQARKTEDRKRKAASGGGKDFTHNVQG